MTRFEKMEDYPDVLQARFNSFITTQFDDSLSVEMQIRSLIKWISSSRDLINDMVAYLNLFIEMFDERLQEEIVRRLNEWLDDGTLAQIINNDVFDMKADKTFVDSEIERLDQKDEDLVTQLAQTDSDLSSVRSRKIYVEDFPKLETDNDDSNRIMRAFNEVQTGDTLVLSGSYLASNIIFDKNDITIEFTGEIIQQKSETGIALQIGSDNDRTLRVNVIGSINVKRDIKHSEILNDWMDFNTKGLKLVNLYRSNIPVGHVYGFNKGFTLEAYGSHGTVYNNITLTHLHNNKTNIHFETDHVGWTNSNKFYGGSFSWDDSIMPLGSGDETYLEAYERLGFTHVHITDRRMNNNIFYAPDFEVVRPGSAFIVNEGSRNHFHDFRAEAQDGKAVIILNGENSAYNQYNLGYIIYFNKDVHYFEYGEGNRIYSRFLDELEDVYIKNSGIRATASTSAMATWHGFDKTTDGVIDAQSTSGNSDKLWVGRDVNGVPTSHITGQGDATLRNIKGAELRLTNAKGGIFGFNTDGFLIGDSKLPNIASLPVPSESERGRFLVVRGGSGEKDSFYVCIKKEDDSYEWADVSNPSSFIESNGDANLRHIKGAELRLTNAKGGTFGFTTDGFLIGDSKLPNIASLPVASENERGRFLIVRGGSGEKDSFYVCIKKEDDSYGWIDVSGPIV